MFARRLGLPLLPREPCLSVLPWLFPGLAGVVVEPLLLLVLPPFWAVPVEGVLGAGAGVVG